MGLSFPQFSRRHSPSIHESWGIGRYSPALLVDANGNLRENIEILPRILYTEKWHLAFCSADEVDLEIFQMGFDAAE
jgi:hypothetical protein